MGWDCSRKETVQGQRDHTSLLLCCCCEILGRVQCGVTHFTIWVPLWQVKATQPGEINSRNVLEWKWTNIGGYFIPCFISWLYKHHHLHGFIIVWRNFEIIIQQVHADKLLKRALDKFFIGETNSSTWHFYYTDVTRFYESDHSKTVKRLQARNQDWALLTNRWTCEVKWFWISDNNKQCCVIKEINLFCGIEFINLCITTYLWIRIKPILHTGSVTLHRQLFSNEKQGATMRFPCLA